MAFDDFDEYEQGEQVRKWIKENGLAVLAGVVIALALIFGWRQWQAYQTNHDIAAAARFAALQSAAQGDNKAALAAALSDLEKNYAKTAYAAFGSAAAADYEIGKNDLKSAAANLAWAVDHTREPALKSLFMLRLARVQLAQGEAQQAINTLGGVPAGDYSALGAELRGDALLQLGKDGPAREAYESALAKLDATAPERHVLQMKLDNLAQPPAAPAGKQP